MKMHLIKARKNAPLAQVKNELSDKKVWNKQVYKEVK